MPAPIRIALYNPDARSNTAFRVPFQELQNSEIIDECTSWNELQEHIRMAQADIVAVNLDAGELEQGILLVQRVNEVAPDTGVLGVSQDSDPNTIIAAMRAGCGQFVRWPIDAEDLRTAVGRLRRTRVASPIACQRLCVVGSSGGAGTTTVACNLALELAHVTERRCGLVDMNLDFGDVACSFDVHAKHTVADVCRGGVDIDRTLVEMAMEELPCKVSVLARPEHLQEAQEVTPEGVHEMFRMIETLFPFVVVDLPRHFGPSMMATLDGADQVFIVSQLAVPFIRNAVRMYDHLVSMGANEERIEIVLNRCKATHERIKPEEVEKQFGRPVFAIIPNDYKHIGASRDLGHPLMTDAPNSPARLAIHEMARKIAANATGSEEYAESSSTGFLGMFGKRR